MNERKYYPFLDGLRGVAILWVIIHHMFTELVYTPGKSPMLNTLSFKLGWAGRYGVDIFFVISGFLITGLLFPKDNGKIDIIRFYKRRCFKILPSYFLAIFGIFYFYLYASGTNSGFLNNFFKILPRYFFFLQSIIPSQFPAMNHLWSIAVEEHFYLTYPVIIYLVYLENSTIPPKSRLLILLVILMVICNLIRLTMVPYVKVPVENTFFRADALAFGCAIRILEDKIVLLPNPRQLTALCFLLGAMVLWFFLIENASNYYWYYFTIAYVASGLLLMSCLLGLSFLTEILGAAILQWIGRISYNLYLWHVPLIFISCFIFKNAPAFLPFLPIFCLFIIFLMGWLTTNTVEKYFLKLRNLVVP